MNKTIMPINEEKRLVALRKYNILDTAPEVEFDNITRIAAKLCNVPVSIVSIIDDRKQWLKSHYGLSITETEREYSFCLHAINDPENVLIVPDMRKDDRFTDHPFVTGSPHVVFYAGVALISTDGYPLGALCVIDYVPHELTEEQIEDLRALGRQAELLLELRRKTRQLNKKSTELNNVYADLEKLSYIASHDLKSPLNNIISLTHLLLEEYATRLDAEGNEYIAFLNEAAYRLSDMVSGVMTYSKSAKIPVNDKEYIAVQDVIKNVVALLNIPATVVIRYEEDERTVYASKTGLKEVLMHLVHNAIKYADKDNGLVSILFYEDKTSFSFEVKDNGIGIAEQNKEKIFNIFERLGNKIKDGESMGLGLAIAKRLVEKMGGEVRVVSEPGKGASFIFSILK